MSIKTVVPKSVPDLLSILGGYGIPLNEWGIGKAKTPEELYDELASAECSLVDEDGALYRVTRVAGVTLTYQHAKLGELILHEACQVFTDFRAEPVRQRPELTTSISEKFKQDESPEHAAARGCKEELGIRPHLVPAGRKEEKKPSPSYPGLWTKYEFWFFEGEVLPNDFSPSFQEKGGNKISIFTWVPK